MGLKLLDLRKRFGPVAGGAHLVTVYSNNIDKVSAMATYLRAHRY